MRPHTVPHNNSTRRYGADSREMFRDEKASVCTWLDGKAYSWMRCSFGGVSGAFVDARQGCTQSPSGRGTRPSAAWV